MDFKFDNNSISLSSGGKEILTHTEDAPMIYVGYGQETVDMYRGNFKIEDYLIERRSLKLSSAEAVIDGAKLDFEGKIEARVTVKNGVANRDSISARHADLAYGIVKRESKQRETEEKVSKAVQWYERPLIWIGSLCCIAVLLYILFIYLKRKF